MADEEEPLWVTQYKRNEAIEKSKIEAIKTIDTGLEQLIKGEKRQGVTMALQSARMAVRVALDLLADDGKQVAVADWRKKMGELDD